MDLDELQSVQSRERQTDSLQQLRETFYRDAAEYIEQLRQKREHAAEEADDPWNSPEITRLSDDIDTAEGTVEAIYERRVGKIVKMASLAAADMPTEDEGLTDEERQLFETLVGSIEQNRDRVFAILDGEDPADVPELGAAEADAGVPGAGDATAGDEPPVPDDGAPTNDAGATEVPPDRAPPASEPDPAAGESESPSKADDSGEPTVDAADLMGGDGPEAGEPDAAPGRETPSDPGNPPSDAETSPSDGSAPDGSTAESDTGSGDDPSERTDGGDAPAVDRATVRITADVGEIFGVDQRAYDLNTEDVVTLPEANAGPLVERDAAERLD